MARKKSNTSEVLLSGPNIYRDKHGVAIYYKKRDKIGYRIAKEKETTFKTLQFRYILVLIVFIIAYILFSLDFFISLGLTLLSAIFMEYRFRKFLKDLPQATGFIPTEKASPIEQMIDTPMSGLILRLVLYFALAILLVVNTFVSSNIVNNVGLKVASYVVSLIAVYIGFKYLLIIIKKHDRD